MSTERKPMTALDILIAERELLSVPERWTKGEAARDSDGRVVWSDSEHAVCWCLGGALRAVAPDDDLWPERVRASDAIGDATQVPLAQFNDDPATTHADMLRVLDEAIESLKGQA